MANLTLRRIGVLSYDSCRALLAGTRSKQVKKLGGNTEIHKHATEDACVVWFYSTPLITFHENGRVVIDTRGHRSVTTKERINALSPISVYQHKGEWYVYSGTNPTVKERFFDGYSLGDTSEKYALYHAAKQGDEVAQKAYSDYVKERE